jgi:signal peptidase I
MTADEPPKRSLLSRLVFGGNPRNTLLRIFFLVLLTFFTFQIWLMPIRVSGLSMMPTFQDGEVRFVNKLSYVNANPQSGDVVCLVPRQEDALYLKRVIGVPGDSLEFRGGRIRVNGERLTEPYIRGSIPWPLKPVKLGADEYFVIGDNRSVTVFGVVSKSQILGKVFF